MPFKELARIALLGTENTVFPDDLLRELEAKGLDVKEEKPLLLAKAAALYAQIKKAGFTLKDFTGKLPEAVKEEDENSCSFKSVRHLQLILDGKYKTVFPEFLHHLLENGKHLPTELLPSLMGRSDVDEWWPLIELTLSPNGKWLLSQHPEWRLRLQAPTDINWETALKPQRTQLLKSLRINEPEKALELLESTWESEQPRDKKSFLKELMTGLSPADELFLEKAINDKRKEVRKEAAELLAKLPLSDYAERMFQRAVEMMHYQKGRWHFKMPDEPDKAAIKDGILKIDLSWKGGAKAGHLGQIFSKIPPSRWELHFEAEPLEVLQMFNKTDWSNVLLRATANAAVFQEDEKWIGAILAYWFDNENSPLWNDDIGQQILSAAPAESVNQLCLAYLNDRKGLPDEETPVFQLLLANDAPWENELAKMIISRLQEWIANTKTMDWRALHYKQFLDMAATRCSPSLFSFLEKGWRTTAPLWYNWENLVTDMLNTVLFRREMILELERG
ncbi:MAG: DUF5691 domain-containing protein [Bacteroidota bacterium]